MPSTRRRKLFGIAKKNIGCSSTKSRTMRSSCWTHREWLLAGMPAPNELKVTEANRLLVITSLASFLRTISSGAGQRKYSGWLRRTGGTNITACACAKTAHDLWRASFSQRCATRLEIYEDFLRSAVI